MDGRKFFILLSFMIILAMLAAPAQSAEGYRWQVNYQHIILDVGNTGQVQMSYEVDANIQQGVWNEVWIPQTDSSQTVQSVMDGSGASHGFHVDGGQIKVEGFNLKPGDHVNLKIYSTLPSFVYTADRAGYDIVTFIPPWWDMTIADTQVKYYLPGNVPKDQVFTGQKLYDNIGIENNRTWVYFQSTHLKNNEQFETAVSFPDAYMAAGSVKTGGANGVQVPVAVGGLVDSLFGCLCPNIFVFIIILFIIAGVFSQMFRGSYTSPVVSMDGIGVNKDLDPAEAATLLRVDPKRVLTMVMFGMMKKGNIKLISTDPVRLELASRQGLKYYEKLFADAIKDNALDEEGLLNCFKVLARRVVDKTRPYCRKDTEAYYKQKIDEAWAAIKAVDTPELKLEKYDTNMFWLMADEQFTKKTDEYVARAPGSDTFNVPSYYWWYPYYFGLPHYYGHAEPRHDTVIQAPQQGAPSGGSAGRSTNTTTASVESFANSISNSVESLSVGVVGGVEKFIGVRNEANAPPPAPVFAPARGGGGSSCACVSCACACVSCACACACAGGGGGCT